MVAFEVMKLRYLLTFWDWAHGGIHCFTFKGGTTTTYAHYTTQANSQLLAGLVIYAQWVKVLIRIVYWKLVSSLFRMGLWTGGGLATFLNFILEDKDGLKMRVMSCACFEWLLFAEFGMPRVVIRDVISLKKTVSSYFSFKLLRESVVLARPRVVCREGCVVASLLGFCSLFNVLFSLVMNLRNE